MEDFTTFCKNQPSLFSRIFSLKMSKDRFWNFVFWLGMSAGFSIAFAIVGTNPQTRDFPYLASVVFWLTIIGVPFLVRTFSKTTFVKDKTFLSSEGRELNWDKDLPNGFLTIVTTVALTALTGAILDKISDPISNIFSSFIFVTVLFGIPSLFFIFKNCPISVLFNHKLLSYIAANAPKSTLRRKDTYTDPSYSFLSHNMFHRKK
nr:hypothetical protein [Candidatus Megaera venefica]